MKPVIISDELDTNYVRALNSLNVPKTQSWGVVRTFNKAVAVAVSGHLISPIITSWFIPPGGYTLVNSKEESNGYDKITKEEHKKRVLQYKIASCFALALEVALSDIVVDEVANRIGNKNVAKEPKKEKNERNPDPANRNKVK